MNIVLNVTVRDVVVSRLTEIEMLLTEAEDKQRQITDKSNSDNHVKGQQIQQLKSELERAKVRWSLVLKIVSGVEGSLSRRGVELFECVTGFSFNRCFHL